MVLPVIGDGDTESYEDIFEKCGGVENATSCGSLPRNRKQVSNFRSLSKAQVSAERHPLFALIEQCKKEESQVDPFIRCVQGAPDAMCVIARERQLTDMVRFCTNPNEFSIVGLDPTFNLGDFSVNEQHSEIQVEMHCLKPFHHQFQSKSNFSVLVISQPC